MTHTSKPNCFGWCECARAVFPSTAWQLEAAYLSMEHTQNVGITYDYVNLGLAQSINLDGCKDRL